MLHELFLCEEETVPGLSTISTGDLCKYGVSLPVHDQRGLASGEHLSTPTTTTNSVSAPQVQGIPPSLILPSQVCNQLEFVSNTLNSPESPSSSDLISADSASTQMPLPPFTPMVAPVFTWREYEAVKFIEASNSIYAEAIHWKINLFKVPYGAAGRSFVSELARLFRAFGESSALEQVAMKPANNSKAREHAICLQRQLNTWKDGDLNELLWEGRTIQQRLPKNRQPATYKVNISLHFANHMFQSKVKAALRLPSEENKGGTLYLDDTVDTLRRPRRVRDILIDKHPPCQTAGQDSIINDDPPDVHPVLFESMDASAIKSAAYAQAVLLVHQDWTHSTEKTLHKNASQELCNSLTLTARRLCTELVDPASIAPFLSCRIIALHKNPGVRPIGIGDTARRIIAKAILSTTKEDIQSAVGFQFLCFIFCGINSALHRSSTVAGIEAGVHTVHTLSEQEDTEAVLLIDASNAFNTLNRQNSPP